MTFEKVLQRFILGAASLGCFYLLICMFLPDEDTKNPPTYGHRWLYHTNKSCEVKPNGYWEYIFDNKRFWMNTFGSMQSWREQWDEEKPYQWCSKSFQVTDENSLRCIAEVQELDDRWKRCYPIVKFKCKEAGYICN